MTFRFLDLIPELRNRVYHFASLSEEQIISSMRYEPDTSLQGIYASLTKVCRQIRAEYLPIQRREAVVAFRWDKIDFMQDWFNTFHPAGPNMSGGPRVVRLLLGKEEEVTWMRPRGHVCVSQKSTCLAMIEDLDELLMFRAHWTSIRFEAALEAAYHPCDESDLELRSLAEEFCHKLCLLLQYDDPTWLTAIRENIFDGIKIEHYDVYAPPVIAVEVGPHGKYTPYYTTQRILPLKKALEAHCGMRVEVWDSTMGYA